jgi:uncharacterized membrane protein YgcG
MSRESNRISASGFAVSLFGIRRTAMLALDMNKSWWAVVCCLVITGISVNAQGDYPPARDPYVNDYAGVMDPQHIREIRTMLTDLNEEADIQATVLTVNSIKEYQTDDETIESFATHLFNSWGIGDRATNNGVLILVAVKDRKVRIELGSGYGSQYNAPMKDVIDEYMLPAFRSNEYGRGIHQGAQAVISRLTGVWPGGEEKTTSSAPGWSLAGAIPAVMAIGIFCIFTAYMIRAWKRDIAEGGSGDIYSLYDRDDSDDSSSSSGTSGSFGGGGSSGGGAGGSW